MKTAFKAACSLLVLALSAMLVGCWDYSDVEDNAVAMGFAIDKAENGGYLLTTEIVHPGTSGGENTVSLQSFRVEATGETIFDCMRNMAKKLENKVYWSDAQVVICSEAVAKDGLDRVLDILVRNLQLRPTLFVVVSKEQTARELFETRNLLSEIQSQLIASKLMNNRQNLSKAPSPYLYEVIDAACAQGKCLALPALEIVNDGGKPTTQLAGTAVFHQEKLIGYLNDEETKAYLFVENKIEGGLLIVEIDTETLKRPDVSLEIIKSKTTVTPEFINNQLSMKINIELDVLVGENQTGVDFSNEVNEDILIKATQDKLERDIQGVVKKVQEFDSDIFGFGATVHEDMPQVWKPIQPFWFERYYKTLPVRVTSKITIKNEGLLRKPLKMGDYDA